MKYFDTEDLPCFRCGVCCRKYQVRLTPAEARGIARQLKMDFVEFLNKYTDPRWPDPATYLIRHQNGACMFLEAETDGKKTRCLIHSHRPPDCRDWTPGLDRPECQQGLLAWGLKASTTGRIEGNTKDLEKFQSFLDSLE